jgi:hypothetical protein
MWCGISIENLKNQNFFWNIFWRNKFFHENVERSGVIREYLQFHLIFFLILGDSKKSPDGEVIDVENEEKALKSEPQVLMLINVLWLPKNDCLHDRRYSSSGSAQID